MNAKQHDRIWKWIQDNLEMYRILEGGIDTSLVQKTILQLYYKKSFTSYLKDPQPNARPSSVSATV